MRIYGFPVSPIMMEKKMETTILLKVQGFPYNKD